MRAAPENGVWNFELRHHFLSSGARMWTRIRVYFDTDAVSSGQSLAVLRISPKRRMVPSQVPTNSTAFRSQTWLSAEIWNLQTTIGWIVLASLVVVVVNTIAGTDNRDTTDATGCYLSVWRKMRSRVSFAASVILVPGPKIAPQLLLSFNKKS